MKTKIVLLACFSNAEIRNHLSIGYSCINRFFRHVLNRKGIAERDLSPWVGDYIKVFEQMTDYDFYVISPHAGMAKEYQSFNIKGINYCFINRELPLFIRLYDRITNYLKRTDYLWFRKRIAKIINQIHPDLFILSGAENIDYSIACLDVTCPKLIILQTLLNSKKRIDFGVGNPYRREMEKEILASGHFFAISENEEKTFIKGINPSALFYPFVYPTSQPPLFPSERKDYDFIFFAGVLSRFKGTSDVIRAFEGVHNKHPLAKLAIIGDCPVQYKSELELEIERNNLNSNIFLLGSFPSHQEMFRNVQKARFAVLPGITAPLNTTVREAMLIGLPTIVYGNEVTSVINSSATCVLEALMENTDDLTLKMIYALEHDGEMAEIGRRGKVYADDHFTPKAVGENLKYILINCLKTSFGNISLFDER